ncbi:TIGR01244 family sulfur transferase [Glaciimonas sp. Gout2]|nr:TIGR01244 family sulfur transferase [Glaciimonas sp. Cout2]MEB0083531.1 TIGR01244 family sulfur transferase [Glaciimonas sp. Gout2]
MEPIVKVTEDFSITGQITVADLAAIGAAGYRSVMCNRPDAEGDAEQTDFSEIASEAHTIGLHAAYLPVVLHQINAQDVYSFRQLLIDLPPPVLAYCRSGRRASTLFQLAQDAASATLAATDEKIVAQPVSHEVLIVGGGAGGIGVAASLLRREPGLQISIIEPSEQHYYQPAWSLVGAGEFDIADTVRPTTSLIPGSVRWLKQCASSFDPENQQLTLSDGSTHCYQYLIVAPGLKLYWAGIAGLEATLGSNGVTSNYRFDLAPYTWSLVQTLRSGRAIFTQPAMPIKCAGAPQKALYLSCSYWEAQGVLSNISVEFDNAGGALFGVAAFVPALMRYIERYKANLQFNSNLVAVDGPARKAWFDVKDSNGQTSRVEKTFDFLHVVPPQVPHDVIKASRLGNVDGWVEVDQKTLQHVRYPTIFGLGDACSTPNAKTVAAVRKQIVVVAENLLALRQQHALITEYDGYGACPLTVEIGKVVLAEFGYGGKLLPTFPIDPTVARRSAWVLKKNLLPAIYWQLMLKGREWLARSGKV